MAGASSHLSCSPVHPMKHEMLRAWSRELDVVLQFVDIAGSAVVFMWVLSLPGMMPDAAELAWHMVVPLALAASLTWTAALRIMNLTRSMRTQRLPILAGQLAIAGGATAFSLGAVAFLTSAPLASQVPMLCGLAQLLTLGGSRLLLHAALRNLRRIGRNTRYVLIAGSGPAPSTSKP